MKLLIDRLYKERYLEKEEYQYLLSNFDSEVLNYINELARETAIENFGNNIYIRGLIEVSNFCRNNCYYCGIRRSNLNVERYRLTKEQILESCRIGNNLGLKTFVLQGGEDGGMKDDFIEEVIRSIRTEFPENAITLSLGEKSKETYQRFFNAGANRYLLRHETANKAHYNKLHPVEMSFEKRMESLHNLKEIGFQTGAGMMVGSPYQTIENLVEDILFIQSFSPQMIGIGPFIPQHDTPFANESAGSIEMTLLLLSILRLILPNALIPSTTALASIGNNGRERGILAGANVVMPNLSPEEYRSKYALYDNKQSFGAEAAEGLSKLEKQLQSIGYRISYERGDYKNKIQ